MVACLERTDGNIEFHQIVDFLTSSTIHYALTDDRVVRAATTAASLEAEELVQVVDPGAMLPHWGIQMLKLEVNTSGCGEDSMEHQNELTNFVPPTPHDSPLSGGHTPRSDEGRPNINELMNLCTQLSNMVLALEQFKTNQDLVIKRFQKKVKRLEKKQRARTPGMKLFNIGTSKKKTLDKENDFNAAEPVLIAGDAVNAVTVIPDVSVVGPSTCTVEDIFKDEMTTMADTLMATRRTRPKITSVVIHDVEEEPRRATPPPIVQSQDKEIAQRLFKGEQTQFEREQRIAREKAIEQEVKDAALIEQMEDVQVRIDADALLAERIQQEEREQFTVDEQARMLVDLITKRNRFFAAQKAEQIRNKPPTKAQLRNKMKLEEEDAEKEELIACLDIVLVDDITINVESLATKYLIVDWKKHTITEHMIQDIIDLYRLVKERYETTSPEGYDLLLWGDLITLFEPSEEDVIWKAQQDYNLISWRLFDSCRVHIYPKKSRGKGSQRKKTVDDSQETVDVSEESEAEPKPAKRKTTSRRVFKKKVTILVADNIIPDLDVALKLGKSISITKAEEEAAAKQVHATHVRIVTESILKFAKKKTRRSSKSKLKGVPSLTQEEQEAADIMKALKEERSQARDNQKICVSKDDNEEMINAEVDDSDKGDKEITDAAKEDDEKTSGVKDDAKKTELPLTSSSLSVSLGFGDQLLKLSSDSSLVNIVKDTIVAFYLGLRFALEALCFVSEESCVLSLEDLAFCLQKILRFVSFGIAPNGEALRKCILSGPYKPTIVLVQAVDVIDDSPAIPEHMLVETPMNMYLENKAHFEAEKEAIHLILTGIRDEIYSTVDAFQTAQEMWEAFERLQQGESLNIQDVKTNLFWEFGKFTSHDGETMESYYTRFYKLMNEMIRNNLTVATMQVNVQFLQQLQPEWSRFVMIVKQQHKLDEVSYHKLFDILKQYQKEVNELRAKRLAMNANPLALVATAQANQDPYYQTSRSHKSHVPSSKPSILTRFHTTTRHKGKEIAKPITSPSKTASEKDSDPEQAQRDKDMQKNLALIAKYFKRSTNLPKTTSELPQTQGTRMWIRLHGSPVVQQSGIQCFNCKEFGHFAKECRKPKRVRDSMYHKEKMLLYKQAQQGVPLQAEQYDWLADTDEEYNTPCFWVIDTVNKFAMYLFYFTRLL
uniref:CCHC-type domain-containing protein n=1 Tax=Tanacetum cinerariifolium TaxID=118510 RepID=A0A6L2K121_TANCI|nr:hypothetical protein [Tanacetum cinerariifolium]